MIILQRGNERDQSETKNDMNISDQFMYIFIAFLRKFYVALFYFLNCEAQAFHEEEYQG